MDSCKLTDWINVLVVTKLRQTKRTMISCGSSTLRSTNASSVAPPACRAALTGWYETESLLRGDDADRARAEVERLAGIVGNNRRYQLPLLRSQAVLAQEIGLPGEE